MITAEKQAPKLYHPWMSKGIKVKGDLFNVKEGPIGIDKRLLNQRGSESIDYSDPARKLGALRYEKT